jgi:hypothetical protein
MTTKPENTAKQGKKEYTEAEVRLAISGAIAAEREECAKECEKWQEIHLQLSRHQLSTRLAKGGFQIMAYAEKRISNAIRARSQS